VRSAAQRRLVRSIVEIGRLLDIEVAAEARRAAARLRLLDPPGYAFAKLMAAEEFGARLRTRQRRIV
jgi:hypothetical protein